MSRLNTTLAAALLAGGVASFANSAGAVPLSASLSLRDAAPSAVETVQWRRWGGWRGWGGGLAAAAIIGGAIAASRPYYGYGYYGYGYPAYSYGYGYPAYSYGYSYPAYSYGYSYPAYSYGYSYGYAPAYSYSYAYPGYYGYASVPRVRRVWRRY